MTGTNDGKGTLVALVVALVVVVVAVVVVVGIGALEKFNLANGLLAFVPLNERVDSFCAVVVPEGVPNRRIGFVICRCAKTSRDTYIKK